VPWGLAVALDFFLVNGPQAIRNTMALELKNVEKRVGADTYIYGANLTLAENGFNILLGTTLSGKTTLMQIMAGTNRPTSGAVWFKGADVTQVPVQKRNVSMVYQQFINYPNFTVFENIASPLRVAGMSAADIEDRVERTAALLQLTPQLQRRPDELSGGQQQRTAIARALVKDADLVLLDEPLANLDYKLREELRDELPKLFADRECTVVYATTEPTEALLLGGHTTLLHEGRIVQFGPTSDIYRNPETLLAAQVFSDPPINTAPVIKKGNQMFLSDTVHWGADGHLASLADGPYTIGIRPHHVLPHDPGGRSVAVEGKVLVTELSGSESTVHFEVAGGTWVSLSHGVHAFGVGERARLYADVGRALVFDPDDMLIAA
jgi:glycerol transport system ATP-binding protein